MRGQESVPDRKLWRERIPATARVPHPRKRWHCAQRVTQSLDWEEVTKKDPKLKLGAPRKLNIVPGVPPGAPGKTRRTRTYAAHESIRICWVHS